MPRFTTKQVIINGSHNEPSAASVRYATLMGNGSSSISNTEANAQAPMPTNGTLSNFQAGLTNAPTAGNSWAFTVRVAGADSALSVTVADAAVTSAVDTDVVSVTAGQLVNISITPTGTPAAGGATYWSCTFTPAIPGETILLGTNLGTAGATTNFLSLAGAHTPDTVEADTHIMPCCAGTFKKFYVAVTAAPGAGTSVVYTLRKAAGNTSVAVTISETGTSGNDTTNTSIAAADDKYAVQQVTGSGAPTYSVAKYGVVFMPDVPGNFPICFVTDDALNTGATEFAPLAAGNTVLTATESETKCLASVGFTLKRISVWLSASPGVSSRAYSFTARKNATTDLATTVTLTATTTGNASIDSTVTAGDFLATKIAPLNSPTGTPKSSIAYLGYIAPTFTYFPLSAMGVG